jgi:hypothetical protein
MGANGIHEPGVLRDEELSSFEWEEKGKPSAKPDDWLPASEQHGKGQLVRWVTQVSKELVGAISSSGPLSAGSATLGSVADIFNMPGLLCAKQLTPEARLRGTICDTSWVC